MTNFTPGVVVCPGINTPARERERVKENILRPDYKPKEPGEEQRRDDKGAIE